MSDRLFGTDGVRGLANGLLTANLATSLGVAAAQVLSERGQFASHVDDRPFAIVGRDGRASGEFLQAAVSAGLASAGVDVIDVGVVPTPAVAFLTDATGADFGVMLSASHNAMPDNGIKFFARGGVKLDDAIEDAIEAHLDIVSELPTGAGVGRIRTDESLLEKYLHHVSGTTDVRLDGLTIVIDAANGAASLVAPEIMRRAGANVIAIHCEPTGLNINDNCGSTHMENLVAAVKEHGADMGIAHDGDADRCLAVDGSGELVDGDQILGLLAKNMQSRGTLVDGTVVATVMSNLGFTLAMRDAGIDVVTTAVGDRYVLEEMRAKNYNLGGEQSGHVVLSEYATTGDGVLTALQLASIVKASGSTLAELAGQIQRLPQVLINVKNVDKAGVNHEAVRDAVTTLELSLAGSGRILLRPSGTEPVIRVMVEAPTQSSAQDIAERLAGIVTQYCGF